MSRSLIVRIIVPAAVVLGLIGQPAWARGPACWNSDELPAAELHAFHTALMVGALRCRGESVNALSSYNAFVEARKSSIDAARTVLEAHFIREMGPEMGLTEFKNFDTEIANRASIAGAGGLPCEGVDVYSRLAASASQGDLYALARLNNSGMEIRSCGSQPQPAAAAPSLKATGRVLPERTGPVLVAAKTDASPGTPQAVAGSAQAAVPDQQDSAMLPKVLAGTQAAGGAAAQDKNANVDPAKALEDAARALALAATSLRTASSAD